MTALGRPCSGDTWQTGVLFRYDLDTFELTSEQRYEGEGWGLTHDGSQFFMSNGSDKLLLRDDQTFAVQQTLEVRDAKRRWSNLNELEYAEGLIWANVWQTPTIVVIAPDTGEVSVSSSSSCASSAAMSTRRAGRPALRSDSAVRRANSIACPVWLAWITSHSPASGLALPATSDAACARPLRRVRQSLAALLPM